MRSTWLQMILTPVYTCKLKHAGTVYIACQSSLHLVIGNNVICAIDMGNTVGALNLHLTLHCNWIDPAWPMDELFLTSILRRNRRISNLASQDMFVFFSRVFPSTYNFNFLEGDANLKRLPVHKIFVTHSQRLCCVWPPGALQTASLVPLPVVVVRETMTFSHIHTQCALLAASYSGQPGYEARRLHDRLGEMDACSQLTLYSIVYIHIPRNKSQMIE